ncbi:uncharacterized protein LOC124685042 [Lolium rigidum]|uniref:uncharacterized protein LOC124685042 n=1 Tax=Lolium rigidum TaxID=89674 RepID=UPI001F5C369D|nr:uncharacterized protein LOC124685042 [Lolium rigidum]
MTAKICFFRICCTPSLSWYIYCHLGVFPSSKFTKKAQNLADQHQRQDASTAWCTSWTASVWSWLARSSAQWCCAVTCHLPTRDRPFMKVQWGFVKQMNWFKESVQP